MTDKLFPDEKVIGTEHFTVHQDWEIPISGFFIISPIRRIRTIDEFTEAESKEYIKLVMETRRGMKEVLNIKDVYFFQNEDTDHNFHLWIFPRHSWMKRFGRKIESVRLIMEYAKKHFVNEEKIAEVKLAVEKMRVFFETGMLVK